MAHDAHIRKKARRLRVEQGLTIDEIGERLALHRSTIYHWVGDLPVERDPERQSAAQRNGTARNVEKHRLLREAAYRRGRREFVELARDPTFRDFVCMYVGEGYKRNRNRVAVGNSDPAVVSLCARWIESFAANKVDYSLQYHAEQDPDWLRRFWGFRLVVEPEAIRLQRKSNSSGLKGRNWRSRFGVLTVSSNDTQFRARLQGWIDETKADWVARVESLAAGA